MVILVEDWEDIPSHQVGVWGGTHASILIYLKITTLTQTLILPKENVLEVKDTAPEN